MKEGSISELITHKDNISSKLYKNIHNKPEQAKSYNKQKENTALKNYDPSIALIQFDLYRDYKCIAQMLFKAIKAYLELPQVSLITCSTWFLGKQSPYAIVLDSLTHSKDTLLVHVCKILELPQEITEVRIRSDGMVVSLKTYLWLLQLRLSI